MKRLLLCLTVLLALLGWGVATVQGWPLASGAPSPTDQSSGPVSSRVPVTAAPGAVTPTRVPPTAPKRLHLDDVDAQVVPIELTGSALAPPEDPRTLGWWGKRAGSRHGTTLLTGHTVHDGGGTFDDLEHTPLGGHARLSGHSYRVESVEVIPKAELAERAPALFAQTGRPKLVLVTCEDYDRATGHYASNVVVILRQLQ